MTGEAPSGDPKTSLIATWMVAAWLAASIVMASTLAAVRVDLAAAGLVPFYGAGLGVFVLVGCDATGVSRMPAALVWITCAATITALLLLALAGVGGAA